MTTQSGRKSTTNGGGARRLGLMLVAVMTMAGMVAVDAATPVSAQTAACGATDWKIVEPGLNTLRTAIAGVGNCFELRAGTYTVDPALSISRSITIKGVGEPGSITGDVFTPTGASVITQPGKRIGVVAVGAGANVTIDGVTITGGNTRTTGGGVLVASGGTLNLLNSTIFNNKAVEGAGIDNNGTLLVDSSTILGNTATKKGGGIRSGGSATIVNSTFHGNTASQGGAISTPGSGKVVHSTITGNTATSSSSAGIDRNGGSLQVFYSIIGDNRRSNLTTAGDCSGTPDLIGFNLVTDSSGCNPVGPIDDVATGALGLGALADNGGATLTRAVLDGSPALDRTNPQGGPCAVNGLAPVTVEDDQRGEPRPVAPGCADLGSFELIVAPPELGIENFDVSVDTSAYADEYGPGTVEVGLTAVSIDAIADALNAPVPPSGDGSGTVESSGVRNVGVRNVGVRNVGVRNVGVRNVGVRNVGVRNVGVRNVGVRNVGVRNVALQEQLGIDSFLTSIPLSEIPLLASADGDGLGLVPEGWTTYLAGTQYDGLPLQSLTIEQLDAEAPQPLAAGYRPFELITLEDIDLTNSVLGTIELSAATLAGIDLASLPLPAGATDWCDVFADLCQTYNLTAEQLAGIDMLSVQLAGGDVNLVDWASIDLGAFVDKLSTYAGDPESTGVRNVGVRNVALFSAGVRNVNLQNSGVRNVGVRNVGVRNVELIVNCPADDLPLYCQDIDANTWTLGQLFEELGPEAFVEGATVGDLLDMLELALVDNPDLLGGLSLADFIALFAPTEQVPWEKIDLEGAQLQNLGDPLQAPFQYVTSFTVTGTAATSLAVTLDLPADFILAAAPGDAGSKLTGGTLDSQGIVLTPTTAQSGGLLFEFPEAALVPGTYELRVPVRAGLVTGTFEAMSSLTAVGATGSFTPSDKVSVEVVPAADTDGGVGTGGSGTPRALSFGDLQLAHIASAGDVDLYQFQVGKDSVGATARVFLSNVPEGSDYDLSIYSPTSAPLRGDLGQSAGTRKSVGDTRYDLDPGDDVFPTDIADDINLDVLSSLDVATSTPYVLTDISSKRANEDEEVVIPAVVEGTYYVAVTSYLSGFSNEPYGLRVRLDAGTELPECRVGDRTVNGVELSVPSQGGNPFTLPGGTNTLYVTNLQWLEATFGTTQANDIVDAALETGPSAAFPDSTVRPAVLDVSADDPGSSLDDDVRAAYANWAAAENRCDPEARNDVVRAIGALLDAVQPATVENIVILGDDGIVPMAAVPDLTGYSNEATYARDVLTDDRSNELAGALGEGYLLSDAPYGTSAGYEIRNAGQQVYVEEVAVGRLVETGDQILRQLENFVDYEGQLDPGTLATASTAPTAAVTGYDFLTDGANAVVDSLSPGVVGGVVTEANGADLLGDTWTKTDFEELLAGGGPDIVSPNAHFDYEALLPAFPDGQAYYSDAELVLTDNPAILGVDRSLYFTMGCHAGLSVSDVQLGFTAADPAADWAQTLAGGDNQWIAHTTYGYGDDEIVAYSERLAELFAGEVSEHLLRGDGAPASLGEAMVRAKQEYFATTFTLTPYDEKILQSWTYYGLPMYQIGGGSTGSGSGSTGGTQSVASLFQVTELEPTASAVTPALAVDVQLNRTTGNSDLNVLPIVGGTLPVTGNLNLVTTADGNYYEVGRNVVTAQHRPVQPLVNIPIPDGTDAAGFLITGLTSTDVRPFDPLYLRPTVDLSGLERRVEPEDSSFPANLQLVTTDATGSQRLLLAGGQFQGDTQRLYTKIAGELQPNIGSDGIGPRFVSVDVDGTDGSIEVTTDGVTERVVVLYQPRNQAQWAMLELTEVNGVWTSATPLPAGDEPGSVVEFFLQAVDDQGDVSITDNKVENFFNAGDPDGGPLSISAAPQANDAGYHNTDVTVTITAANATDFDYVSLNGDEIALNGTAQLVVPVTTEGDNVIFARDSSGSGQLFPVRIDKSAPSVTVSTSPNVIVGSVGAVWAQSTSVSLSATSDGAPTTKVEYKLGPSGSEPAGWTLYTGSFPAGTEGHAVWARATDAAGNVSVPVKVDLQIDTTAPSVSVSTSPTNVITGTAGAVWARSTSVSLSVTPAGAPTTTIEYKLGPSTSEPADWTLYTGSFPAGAEGDAVWARATDAAGNVSVPVKVDLQIDTTVPTATLTVPSPLQVGNVATATASCTDALSGIKSSGGCVLSGAVNPATGALDTTTVGVKSVTLTASDNAGNTTTTTAAYTVGYRVCEQYDFTKAGSAGSAYPIKIQLCDANGRNLSSQNIKVTAIVAINTATGEQRQLEPDFSGGSNTGFEFRFGSKSYVYNLKTDGFPSGSYLLGFVTTSSSLSTAERDAIVAANGSTSFARFTIG